MDNKRVLRFQITAPQAGMTVRAFLGQELALTPHQISRLKFQEEGIRVDGRKVYVNHVLLKGEILTVGLTEQVSRRDTEGGRTARVWEPPAPSLCATPLRVLYEDEDIIVVDKPAGLVVHPSPGHYSDTLSNQVAEHLGAVGTALDIRVTGRLDKETSGIVTFAQNTEAAAMIQRQRAEGSLTKIYLALAEGHVEQTEGVVDVPLRRLRPGESFASQDSARIDKRMTAAPDGKPARTFYRVLEYCEDEEGVQRTLLACRIEHGRTHQIRVHMAYIGHPLAGDPLYGAAPRGSEQEKAPRVPSALSDPRMCLHAWRLSMRQPFTGERIEVEAKAPDWADTESLQSLKSTGLYEDIKA